jgi:hypothetical protein
VQIFSDFSGNFPTHELYNFDTRLKSASKPGRPPFNSE